MSLRTTLVAAIAYVLVLAIAGPLLASRSGGVARVIPAWLLGRPRPPEDTSSDLVVGP